MVVHYFVVEDGVVEGESESNWVAGVERFGGGLGFLIVIEGAFLYALELISSGTFGNVSIVITNHLIEEGLSLIGGGNLHALLADNFDDVDTLVVKFTFDFRFVTRKSFVEFLVLWILLDGSDGSNGSSLGTNLVLESNREEVSFFGGEVLVLGSNHVVQVIHHVVESFSLFGNSGHKNVFFEAHF